MTQREFGVQYNTGEEPRRKTVEALKAESAAAELAEITAQVEAKRAEYDTLTIKMNAKKVILKNAKKQVTTAKKA